ncbi:hypothetical protein QOK74_08395 [Staphylococcus saprophyticus]|uniref:hypothetical protein n=1 Tax=Staphylococcus saprophyticus TaxID=29385 RepID=UPI0024C251DD|nr:hypothetical protein [Staphylococcus saprophyticus]MDK1672891.1 hypothetical protein [Staphylococcus saprophyticus]
MSIFDRLSVLKTEAEIKVIEGKDKVAQKAHEMRYGKWDDSPMTKERKQSEKARKKRERDEHKAAEKERRAAEREERIRLQEIEAEKQRKEEEERENIQNWIFAYAFRTEYKEDGSSVLTCPQCTGTNISATTWEEKNADLEEDNGSYLKRICAACGHTQTINLDNPSKIYENKFW